MKRMIAWALALALLAGCGYEAEEQGTPPKASRPEASVQTGEGAVDYSLVAGTYVDEDDTLEAQYRPSLELREDGTFRFTANLLTGMGHLDGSYALEASTVTLTVEEIDFQGFAGDDVKTLAFDVASQTSLMYRGTDKPDAPGIGITGEMDMFRKAE